MYDAETNTPALARTSNLNEELGQVKIRVILDNLNEMQPIFLFSILSSKSFRIAVMIRWNTFFLIKLEL